MPLPIANSQWPPRPFGAYFNTLQLNAAWFENDMTTLNDRYAHSGDRVSQEDTRMVNGRLRQGGLRGLRDRYWNGKYVTRSTGNDSATSIHSPLATNIAGLSADLLTSDPGTVRTVGADGDTAKGPVQSALDDLLNTDESRLAFRRGSEWSAGIAGAAYSWAWDASLNEGIPWLQPHAADTIIPVFRAGRLSYLYIVDTYPGDGDLVMRHIVCHDPGAITHALFAGRIDNVGEMVPFDSKQAQAFTPHLVSIPSPAVNKTTYDNGVVSIATGTLRLTAAYQVNKPTITYRKEGMLAGLGRADMEGGGEPWLDAHDETWSSLMRDLKLGRGRLLIDRTLLENSVPGGGATFDDLSELFTPVEALSTAGATKLDDLVSNQQFTLRIDEHIAALQQIVAEALQFGGYSQSSYGENQAAGADGETATATVDRAKKSERTRDAKLTYLGIATRGLALSGLDLMNNLPGVSGPGKFDPKALTVTYPDVSQIDPEKDARIINYLVGAKAMSSFIAVKRQHPDWSTIEVQTEVKRIVDMTPVSVQQSPFDFGAPNSGEDTGNETGQNDAGANDNAGTPAPSGD